MIKDDKGRIFVTIPIEVKEYFEKQAKEQFRNLSNYTAKILVDFYQQKMGKNQQEENK